MPRRVILPGADELFRSTGSVQRPAESDELHANGAATTGNGAGTAVATSPPASTSRTSGPRHPSGRQRHD
jgi:hypothetical protein